MALRLRRGTDAERQQPGFIPESGELIYTTDTKSIYVGDGTTDGGLPISSGTSSGGDLASDLSPQLGGPLDLNSYNITGTGSIDTVGSISVTGAINTDGSVVVAGSISAASISASSVNISTAISTPEINTDTLLPLLASSVSLGSNLNLNNNNIVGIGNINIDGTITATGNINLGDESTDLITITGNISSNIIPSVTETFALGSIANTWQHGYFSQLTVTDIMDINALSVGDILKQDSSLLYDSVTDQLTANIGVFDELTVSNILKSSGEILYDGQRDVFSAEEFEGIHRGSVIGDDSSVFFDAQSSTVSANTAFISELFGQSDALYVGSNDRPVRLGVRFEGSGGEIISLETTVDSDAFINFDVCRGTLLAKEAVEPGDIISGALLAGYTGSDFIRASAIVGQVDPAGAVSSTVVPGKLLLINSDSGGDDVIASFNSAGVFDAPVLKTGEYATVVERDTAVTSPSAGSIVFVTDGGKLQVYNGANWSSISNLLTDIEDVTGTAYTVTAADVGKLLTFRDAGAVTVTLPDAADTTVPVGAYVEIANLDNTNPVSITGTVAQVLSKEVSSPSVPGFGTAKAVKISTTEWLVTGDTA